MTPIVRHPDLPTDSYSAPRPVAAPTRGLGVDQKKLMGITAATLLLGGGVGLLLARPGRSAPVNPEPRADEVPPAGSGEVLLSAGVDVAGKITDGMSFKQAFRAARDEVGVGGVFNWHGRWYNTFEKEEWSSLSLEQRQDYMELVTGEKLPIQPYHQSFANQSATPTRTDRAVEPTVIEGYLNGQRTMGLDVDRDGIIDAIVLEGADGYTYRVVDATGNDGLDRLYRYDPLNGQLMEMETIDQPFFLTNDQFSQSLEVSMAKEVVDSILESDVPDTTVAPADEAETVTHPEDDYSQYTADVSEPDDTYINDGDVHDMDH